MKTEKAIEKVNKYCKKHLTEKRYSHSVRVAELCQEIAEKVGYDARKAYLAGIAHDICKEIPKDKMLKMVQKEGYQVGEHELKYPSLLHGKAGAVFLQKKFKITDPDVINAISVHVSGSLFYGPLAEILFIADKNERGRPHITEDVIQEMLSKDLREMLKFAVKSTYDHLVSKGYDIYNDTYDMMDRLGLEK